jgi:hypothetical protein
VVVQLTWDKPFSYLERTLHNFPSPRWTTSTSFRISKYFFLRHMRKEHPEFTTHPSFGSQLDITSASSIHVGLDKFYSTGPIRPAHYIRWQSGGSSRVKRVNRVNCFGCYWAYMVGFGWMKSIHGGLYPTNRVQSNSV